MKFNADFLLRHAPRFFIFLACVVLSAALGMIVVGAIFGAAPSSPLGKAWFAAWLILGLVLAALWEND